jgi:hypothetical protein
MSPSRRKFLRAGGPALGLAVGFSGCLSSSDGGRTPGETTAPTESETTASPEDGTTDPRTTASPSEDEMTDHQTTGTVAGPPPEVREVDPSAVSDRGVPRSPDIESDTYEPFRGFVVGEVPDDAGNRYQTPHVWVWNLTDDPSTVKIGLTSADTELHQLEAEFPAGAPLAFVFRDRRTYELAVSAGGREETVAVEDDRFWCNATGTDVLVKRNGIEADTISTAMACTTTAGGS